MGFDFFAAELPCSTCGKIVSGAAMAHMQTRIQRDPQGAYLQVGAHIDIAPGGPSVNGYLTIRPPQHHSPIRLLEVWSCPFCGATPQWAEVILEDEMIRSITAVPLNRETLDRVHYITDELTFYYDDITGVTLFLFNEEAPPGGATILRSDWLKRLRENL
jgi:hypothetical protein